MKRATLVADRSLRTMPTLRPYEPRDRAACLALFDGNAPPFFAPAERADFEEFLDHPPGAYLVVDDEGGAVVGCGGVTASRSSPSLGELTWGMVARTKHGKGIGRFLLLARLFLLAERPRITRVRLDTSQHTRGFFEREGFAVQAGTPNGYAPGLHRYEMTLSLDSVRRERIRKAAAACGATAVAGLRVDLLKGTARRPVQQTILLDPDVADAFGVDREATLLPDGLDRRTFRSGNVVLRRVGEGAEAEAEGRWTAELFGRIAQRGFWVPTPIRAPSGERLVRGWTAEAFLEGRPARPSDAPQVAAAVDAFHRALEGEPLPAFRTSIADPNPWDRADHWAWGELPTPIDPRLSELLARLAALRRPLPELPHQLIHGDLNPDNILIGPEGSGLAPGIIDMTPYRRPAGYAAAVAAYWLGPYRGDAAVLEHFAHVPHFPQLLVRAALRMLLTFRDLKDVGDVEQYVPAIDVIAEYVR
jgi:uncharacterized protein (TIGR02569 family)